VRRRYFLKVIAGWLVVWPLAAGAQQAAVPVIGFLGGGSLETDGNLVAGFLQGLSESGYIEGRKQTTRCHVSCAGAQFAPGPSFMHSKIR
jgi:putative tryptophan/tyrosine transport system substrate-binding protein